MTQLHDDQASPLPLPDEEALEEYLELVFDNGEGTRDRYMVIVVDDEGQAHTLSAGISKGDSYSLLDAFEGRPKNRNGRRIRWDDLPLACQGLFWREVENINAQYR